MSLWEVRPHWSWAQGYRGRIVSCRRVSWHWRFSHVPVSHIDIMSTRSMVRAWRQVLLLPWSHVEPAHSSWTGNVRACHQNTSKTKSTSVIKVGALVALTIYTVRSTVLRTVWGGRVSMVTVQLGQLCALWSWFWGSDIEIYVVNGEACLEIFSLSLILWHKS